MKNGVKLVASIAVVVGLSGCAQVSKTADKLWGGTKSAAKFVSSPVTKLLRGSPDQDYVFVEDAYSSENYEVELYETPLAMTANNFTGGDVELYDMPALRPAPVQTYAMSNPREVSFVRLNGNSEASDWRYCETMNKGYLFASQTEFRVNPEFEVCMRNKGYVMESEVAHYGDMETGVRAPQPSTSYSSGYAFP